MSTEPKVEYYHVTCLERLLPDLSALVRDGHLKIDGCISAPLDGKVCLESSAEMIADWFKYEGRTFDLGCYENFRKDPREWDEDWSVRWINHQLGHGAQPDNACKYCQSLPDPEESKKSDYFPEAQISNVIISTALSQGWYSHRPCNPGKKKV